MKGIVIAVDPGVRKVGLACFMDGVLVHAQTLMTSRETLAGELVEVARAALQKTVSPTRRAKAKVHFVTEEMVEFDDFQVAHHNLADVGEQTSRIELELAKVWPAVTCKRLAPRAWKAAVPKPVMQTRIAELLTVLEMATLRDQGHDTWDSVGIGLFFTKRMKRGGA
jgi:hypothetical protein